MLVEPGVDQVVIVGAGIIGLTLGQFLRNKNIPFTIFERGPKDGVRPQGWGLTLHWSLEYLLPNLPPDTRADIFTAQVDCTQWENDTGNFLFLDLATLEPKLKTPPAKRLRVQRDRLRKVLMKGLEDRIVWGKKVVGVEVVEGGGAAVSFEDGTKQECAVVVGADGAKSAVRQIVAPQPQLNTLPIQMLGIILRMTEEEAAPLQAIDPLLFQGNISTTGTFMYTSLLDVSVSPKVYTYQFCISYPTSKHTVSLSDQTSLQALIRTLTADFHPTLRSIFHSLPPDTVITPITIADWDSVSWDNHGRITLVGDAAHAMTMFRGDGANQGIMDVFELSQILVKLYQDHDGRPDADGIRKALDGYEVKMRDRARNAVLLSRKACLDAHGLGGTLDGESPVVSSRVKT